MNYANYGFLMNKFQHDKPNSQNAMFFKSFGKLDMLSREEIVHIVTHITAAKEKEAYGGANNITELLQIMTRQRVEEDRKPQILVAIVRIMKARRVLDHINIDAEVTKQLQSRFLPNQE